MPDKLAQTHKETLTETTGETIHTMHEFSLMQGVLQSAVNVAQEAKARRVSEIRLVIGEMREVLPDAMEFAFEALVPDTLCEGAALKMTVLKPRSRCLQCNQEYEHDRFHWMCPSCESLATELLVGRELYIDAIEVDLAE